MSTFYIKGSEPKLKYHIDKGEGEVKFPDTWKECDIVWQLDCLNDWIFDLQKEYERLQEEDAKKHGKGKSQLILGCLGHGKEK